MALTVTMRAHINNKMGGLDRYIKELWRYKHLIVHLATSDLRSRFRGMTLGIFWAIVQPLVLMAMFSVMLGQVSGQPFQEYTTYVLSGTVMWEFIVACCSSGSTSYLQAAAYLMQVPIPLGVFTLRVVLNALIMFAIGLVTLVLYTLIIYPVALAWTWVYIFPFTVLLVLFCIPQAIICGLWNARFRDFQQMLALLLQGLWFISPVFIPRTLFESSPTLSVINQFNPIARLCDMFRGFWMKGLGINATDVGVLLIWIIVLWVLAIWQLSKLEKRLIFYLH
jgi:lipopolysaccharide transport system permease protein